MFGRRRDSTEVDQLVRDGYAAWEAEDWTTAGRLLEQAAPEVTDRRQQAVLWFDAALAFKSARDWPKAYELGKHAAALVPRGEQDPAYWNLGIAATVLADWATARDAWAGYGVQLPPGEGEIRADLGPTCVRIQTDEGQEVVWARRLCPTRARVISVPFHPSRRFGEVVLHDGVPNGERVVQEARYPVFDEIMLFAPSGTPTLSVLITAAGAADTEALAELFAERDFGSEVMSSRSVLCKCCSEGTVNQQRAVEAGSRQVLLGAPEDAAHELLDAWQAAGPDARSWSNLHVMRAR
jgi:hypothetical protein